MQVPFLWHKNCRLTIEHIARKNANCCGEMMPFFKGKEDMGLEASLKLLDLAPDATIEDANQAYADLHRMIDLFHKDAGSADKGSREEDLELLTSAYEKAIVHLSDRSSASVGAGGGPSTTAPRVAARSTDLHFTINFPDSGDAAPKVPVGT